MMLALTSALLKAQPPAPTIPVQMTVTLDLLGEGKRMPDVTRSDVKVQQGKDNLKVTGWEAARGDRAGLDLFILIDDASDSSLGSQLSDLTAFIKAQPATTSVGVGYMRNATVQVVQNFTNDGIDFVSLNSDMSIYNSQFINNGHDGVLLQASDSHAYIEGSSFDSNAYAGADSAEGKITVSNSSAHYNGIAYFAHGGNVSLYNDRAIFNTVGLEASATGHLYFADCLLSDNKTSWSVAAGGVLAGSQPGTTLIAPGQSTHGTASVGTVLQ